MGVKAEELAADALALLKEMDDEERLVVFRRFCGHCGTAQPEDGPRCQCWNDE